MDADRFDRLTKLQGGQVSRRFALAHAFGLAALLGTGG